MCKLIINLKNGKHKVIGNFQDEEDAYFKAAEIFNELFEKGRFNTKIFNGFETFYIGEYGMPCIAKYSNEFIIEYMLHH